MKAIMLMFDSLNRHMLPPYGCAWVHAPNFQRLAARTATFDNAYVGSMPCMPARRELHTGRYNFLHRSWGPLEPFDDSTPELLKKAGVCSHLTSDHYHYWEEGGANYHTRYSSWEAWRGQEGDPWMADLNDPTVPRPNNGRGDWGRQDWVNRAHMQQEEQQPQAMTMAAGLRFLDRNHKHDNWFLHIETFDPHEPYVADAHYRALYPFCFDPDLPDWPDYAPVGKHQRELVSHFRYLNAALISMCDHYLGRVLDAMDRHKLWDDTLLIVNTDHGFLLGEHDWWGKCRMPFYSEIARTPLFIWDPRSRAAGVRRQALVQTIDLPATLLEYFGQPLPADMQGVPLRETTASDRAVREAGLFGVHGGHVNVTDGRYVYMRAPAGAHNQPLYNYTLMPAHMRRSFGVEEMRQLEGLAEPFRFTKSCRTMRIRCPRSPWTDAHGFGTLLFDLRDDPAQERPLQDPAAEAMMVRHLVRLMRANDAPPEQYERLGLEASH